MRLGCMQPVCPAALQQHTHHPRVVMPLGVPIRGMRFRCKAGKPQPHTEGSTQTDKPGPPGPPGPPGRRTELQLLAGHAAYTGTVGTLAVVAANALQVDLASMFTLNWNSMVLGLALLVPLQIYNGVLLMPDWSSWSLPQLTSEEVAAELGAPAPGITSLEASTSASARPDEALPAMQVEGDTRSLPAGVVPAGKWGASVPTAEGPSSIFPDARTLKDAAHLTQGHYLASNPAAHMSVAGEVAVAAVDSLASELLFRGVLLTSVAAWLRDRAYEANTEGFVALPASLAHLINTATNAVHVGEPGAAVDAAVAAATAGVTATAGLTATAVAAVTGGLTESGLEGMVGLEEACLWGAGGLVCAGTAVLALRRVATTLVKMRLMADIRQRIVTVTKQRPRRGGARGGTSTEVETPVTSKPLDAQPPVHHSQSALDPHQAASSDRGDDPARPATNSTITGMQGPHPPHPSSQTSVVEPASSPNSSIPQQHSHAGDCATGRGAEAPPPPSAPASTSGESQPPCSTAHTTPPVGMAGSSLPGAADGKGTGSLAGIPTSRQGEGHTAGQTEPEPGLGTSPQGEGHTAEQVTAGRAPEAVSGDKAGARQGPTSSEDGSGRAGSEASLPLALAAIAAAAPPMAELGRGGRPDKGRKAFDAVVWASGLQASRDLLQGATFTLTFCATGGNLAVCVTSSLINQLIFSTLQRSAMERQRKRSGVMALEFAAFNTRLRDIATKQAEQKKLGALAAAEAAKNAPPPPPAPPLPPPERATNTRLGRTLSSLDRLVPEQVPSPDPFPNSSSSSGKPTSPPTQEKSGQKA